MNYWWLPLPLRLKLSASFWTSLWINLPFTNLVSTLNWLVDADSFFQSMGKGLASPKLKRQSMKSYSHDFPCKSNSHFRSFADTFQLQFIPERRVQVQQWHLALTAKIQGVMEKGIRDDGRCLRVHGWWQPDNSFRSLVFQNWYCCDSWLLMIILLMMLLCSCYDWWWIDWCPSCLCFSMMNIIQ
jgi:hypothetical protein